MWIYDRPQSGVETPPVLPRLHVTQLSYMPRPLPWLKYPHIHQEEYELSYVLSGHGTLCLPGSTRPLARGSLVLVPPGTAHYYHSSSGEDLEYYALRIHQGCDPETAGQLSALGSCTAQSSCIGALQSLLDAVSGLASQNGGVIDRTIQIIFLAIWELTDQELSRLGEKIDISIPEYANDILCYLQEHLHEKITLADLSQQFNLSASHISRVFSKAYHVSPIQYLIMSRMSRARTYILNERLPPAEIARRLAYGDTYQFVSAFTKFFGCRPEEYYELAKRTEE